MQRRKEDVEKKGMITLRMKDGKGAEEKVGRPEEKEGKLAGWRKGKGGREKGGKNSGVNVSGSKMWMGKRSVRG